ncbi:MAG: methyltransferase domain-containing protein [Sulfurovum sp.]|nr:methyltransferase domain-containing protein [Sulfurovum sp.]MCB4745509.1 methyltransferase domain-containing protein [Sulfurovum sp.]MCB4745595.1 methyltransferase domain-containing protein [Sulfurovum sp.]MCB4749044.1 methyltransferase domain-containing protein [Sulfurovum sp.]MCB4750986.1 methyltransferase domain-containing protein [Sulfurovum sp.]
MSEKDRQKWNKKYHQKPQLLEERSPSSLVVDYYTASSGTEALDVACGGGRHTLFLAKKGFHVDAVDISDVALDALTQKSTLLPITPIKADLETFMPVNKKYDLVIMTNYLDRVLISQISTTLKKGALFIVETYMEDSRNEKKDSNPDFLLKKEELKHLFPKTSFDILFYDEYWNESYEIFNMRKQGIVVKKI